MTVLPPHRVVTAHRRVAAINSLGVTTSLAIALAFLGSQSVDARQIVAGPAVTPSDVHTAPQGDVSAVRTIPAERCSGIQFLNPEYLVFLPREHDGSKLPLVIFLHGAGGVGDDITQPKVRGKPTAIWEGIRRFGHGPAIVVAPQCLKRGRDGERGIWTPEDLNLFLEHLEATLPVDRRRIYLTGISMGGYGTWAWAAHDPQHFAAVAPIVGGIGREGPKAVTPEFDEWARSLARIPVHAFVGALDETVPPERSERMIAAIQKAGGRDATLTVYPDEGHGAGKAVVADRAFYDWLFSHTRDEAPSDGDPGP